MAFNTSVHEAIRCLKRKIRNYRLLFPRFGGFFASSGVLISGRICVIGKHWYSSQAHAGHFLRSCSLLSSVSSFPQSIQTYLPGPTFCPALYVFCSVKRFTKTFMHANDIYGLCSCNRISNPDEIFAKLYCGDFLRYTMAGKVIGILGSPLTEGNTALLLDQALKGAGDAGCTVEKIVVATLDFQACQEMMFCKEHETCIMDDDMQEIYPKFRELEGLIVATPVMTMGIPGKLKS